MSGQLRGTPAKLLRGMIVKILQAAVPAGAELAHGCFSGLRIGRKSSYVDNHGGLSIKGFNPLGAGEDQEANAVAIVHLSAQYLGMKLSRPVDYSSYKGLL